MHPGDGCSYLAAHSVMTHTESFWFRHVSLFSRTLPCAQPSFPQHSQQEAPADGASNPPASKERRIRRGPASCLCTPDSFSCHPHTLPGVWTPYLSIYQSQMLLNSKNMDLSSSKRKVKWHISLRPIWQQLPKTKEQVRTDLVHTAEQDSRKTWGLWEIEEDQ